MITYQHRRCWLLMIMAFIIAVPCGNSYAEDFGRLFTTAEERSLLEKMRNKPSIRIDQMPPVDDHRIGEGKPVDSGIIVKGFVYRKSGRSTVWINNSHTFMDIINVQQLSDVADEAGTDSVLFNIPEYKVSIRLRTKEMHHPQESK